MNRDSHPDLGPRQVCQDDKEALTKVREVWSSAQREGSTGYEASYWVRDVLVAHQWPVKPGNFRDERVYLRIGPRRN